MNSVGFAAQVSEIVRNASAQVVDAVAVVQEMLGPVPAGFDAVPLHEQLADYLLWRSDPAAWEARIAEWGTESDRAAGYAIAVREADRLERALLRRGQWDGTDEDVFRAVRAGIQAVQMRRAAQAITRMARTMRRTSALDQKPKAIVIPDEPIPSVLDLISGGEHAISG